LPRVGEVAGKEGLWVWVGEPRAKLVLVLLPGPDDRGFFTGRLAKCQRSPLSVTYESSLRFSRRGDLLLLLLLLGLLLPRGETAREGEAEECSIVQRFRLLKATACLLETLGLGAQGKESSWWCFVVVGKERKILTGCGALRKGRKVGEKSRICFDIGQTPRRRSSLRITHLFVTFTRVRHYSN
jgi:hypothetical protein